MIKQIITVFAIVGFTLSGAEQKIIDQGNIKSAVITPPAWIKHPGFLEVSGPDLFVGARYSLKAAPFKVKAKIAIEKLNGTAASLMINGNNIGLDGSDGRLFLEGPDFRNGSILYKSPNPLKSNLPFELEVDSDNKFLTVKINSQVFFQEKFTADKKITVSLRPHRAKMKIYDFSIQGEIAARNTISDIAGKRLPKGSDITAFSINEPAAISYELPDGKWNAGLKSTGKFLPLKTAFKNKSIVVNIEPDLLKRAYKAAPGKYNLKRLTLKLHNDKNKDIEKYILAYDPKQCLGFRKAEVKVINGAPSVLVNGIPEGVIQGKVSRLRNRYRADDDRDFARTGLHGSIIWVSPRQFYNNGRFQYKKFNDYLEKSCLEIVRNTPDNSISFFWVFYTNKEWGDQHPGELIVTDPKVKSFKHSGCIQPSYASKAWREHCADILTQTLQYLKQSPLADRFVSMKLGYGNCSEWNNFGYHEKAFPDLSVPMQKAFGSWLKNKYQTNNSLRKAWNRENAALDSLNLVPGYKERMQNSTGVFRSYPNDKQTGDYYEFWQEYTVDTIEFLAKKLKELTDGKLLAGAYYGYFIGHISASPYHFQDSGHYALGRYLCSPYLDFVSAPYPYNNRLKNAPVNGAFSSVKLHGKIWESENDQRTHRSGKDNLRYGTTSSLGESIAVAKRDFMQNLAKGGSYYFYDFVSGWYQDKEFMETVRILKKIDDLALKNGRDSIAQVAVLLDEKVIPMISNHSGKAMDELSKMLVYNLDAAGAPWDCYLMSDLRKIDFSNYKLVIMANAYYLDQNERRAIKKYLYNQNRSVLFMYAPGIIDKNGKTDYQAAFELTGMKFAPAGNIVKLPFSPLWTATDKNIKILQTFRNNKPAVVLKDRANYKIFFAAAPGINSQVLSKIYKIAGVHCYTLPGDSLFACGNFIGIYSRRGGIKTIKLPRKVEAVYDLFTGQVIRENTDTFTVNMPKKTSSVILYTGEKGDNIINYVKNLR